MSPTERQRRALPVALGTAALVLGATAAALALTGQTFGAWCVGAWSAAYLAAATVTALHHRAHHRAARRTPGAHP